MLKLSEMVNDKNLIKVLVVIDSYICIRQSEITAIADVDESKKGRDAIVSNALMSLRDAGLVTSRQLPGRAGDVFFITFKGELFLNSYRPDPNDSKPLLVSSATFQRQWHLNVGDRFSKWEPPVVWETILFTNVFLAKLAELGFKVYSKREVRKRYKNIDHYPSGMACDERTGEAYFIYSFIKKQNATAMAKFLRESFIDREQTYFGCKLTKVVAAYNVDQKNNMSLPAKHRERIESAISRTIDKEFSTHLMEMTLAGHAIKKLTLVNIGYKNKFHQEISRDVMFEAKEELNNRKHPALKLNMKLSDMLSSKLL